MRNFGKKGYTLVEIVVVIVVSGVVLGSLAAVANAYFESQAQPSVVYGGETIAMAPANNAVHAAVALHDSFRKQVAAADSVFILGGDRPNPTLSSTTYGTPIAVDFLPTTFSAMASIPAGSIRDSYTFLSTNSTQFTGHLDAQSPTNFTVVTLRLPNVVTSITQSRRYQTTSPTGQAAYVYEVLFYEGVALSSPGVGNPPQAYRYWVPVADESYSTPPGAKHNWYRWDTNWGRYEEAPTSVVFPDPLAYGSSGYTTPFTYLLNVTH